MATNMIEALKQITILSVLPPTILERLSEFAVRRQIRSGETVFCQGEPSPYCFGIVSGEVTIQRVSRNRRFPSKVLSVLGPGELFGESALFEESPRSAMASASRDGELVAIVGAKFREWIQKEPALGGPLLMAMLKNSLFHLRLTSRELSIVHGIGRLLSTEVPFRERAAEALEFLRTSLEGIDEVLYFERSPFWEEFQPVASAPQVVGLPTLPAEAELVQGLRGASGPIALSSPSQRQAIVSAKLPWEHAAACAAVPLLNPDRPEDPLQGLVVLASYQHPEIFSRNLMLLLSAVSHPLAEAMARQRRMDEAAAQSRLSQSRRTFNL